VPFEPPRCQPLRTIRGGERPIFALHHSHGERPILTFFVRVAAAAVGATCVRSTLPVVYTVVAIQRLPTNSNFGAPGERSARTSRIGGWPKKREYSRLNCVALS